VRQPAQPQPDPAADSPRQPEQPDSATADSFAQIEARRLDSYTNWLDSNQGRRGELTPRRNPVPRTQTPKQE